MRGLFAKMDIKDRETAGIIAVNSVIEGKINWLPLLVILFNARRVPEKKYTKLQDAFLLTLFEAGVIDECDEKRLFGVFLKNKNCLRLCRQSYVSFGFKDKNLAVAFFLELQHFLCRHLLKEGKELSLSVFNPEKERWIKIKP
ncbi:MAG: hypothetical protein WC178_02275 [Candidatus Paceibacterota bacterium]